MVVAVRVVEAEVIAVIVVAVVGVVVLADMVVEAEVIAVIVVAVVVARGGIHWGAGGATAPLFGRGTSSRTPQAPFHYYYFIIILLFFRKVHLNSFYHNF